MTNEIAQDEWGIHISTTEEYWAPGIAEHERRQLHLFQRTATEAEGGAEGAAGSWCYEWSRASGYGYATMDEARAAGLAEMAEAWPGLVLRGR